MARYPASYPATTTWRCRHSALVSCRLSQFSHQRPDEGIENGIGPHRRPARLLRLPYLLELGCDHQSKPVLEHHHAAADARSVIPGLSVTA